MKKLFSSRTAQAAEGQIAVYVIAAVIIVLILIYGYKAVQDFQQKAGTVSYIQFKKDLQKTVQSIAGDPGSELIEEFRLPKTDDEVCFVSDATSGVATKSTVPFGGGTLSTGGLSGEYGLIADSVSSKEGKNVFLFKKGSLADSPFFVENLKVESSNVVLCFKASGYRVKIKFEGTGEGTFVKSP